MWGLPDYPNRGKGYYRHDDAALSALRNGPPVSSKYTMGFNARIYTLLISIIHILSVIPRIQRIYSP